MLKWKNDISPQFSETPDFLLIKSTWLQKSKKKKKSKIIYILDPVYHQPNTNKLLQSLMS